MINILKELYSNQDLYNYQSRILRCSDKGLLYWKDTTYTLAENNAKKAWNYLHQNRKDLLIFRHELNQQLSLLQ